MHTRKRTDRRSNTARRLPGPIVLAGLLVLAVASGARATCNAIPGTTRAFRGTLGVLDRPFVRPGDPLTLTLDPICHAASAGFPDRPGRLVVTAVFTPLAGPRTVVVSARDCGAFGADLARCRTTPGVARVECVEVRDADAPEIVDAETLRFRFPDTDAVVDAPDDGITLAGPVTLAVSRRSDPLPCDLAATPCSAKPGLLACVDRLFAPDGACGTAPHETFPQLTALPDANDFQALCTGPAAACRGRQDTVRFALDAGGNILVPVDWRGVLQSRRGVPLARLLRGASTVEAFPNSGTPIRLPGRAFLASYSVEGARLPPLFDLQLDPTAEDAVTLFGTADAAESVLRIARRSSTFRGCVGGEHDGLPCLDAAECPGGECAAPRCVGGAAAGAACTADAGCPGGECGPSLFDFTSRVVGGVGPVVLGDFTANALDPVPLDGLAQTRETNAFVLAEAIDDRDLNGDADRTDDVLRLARRVSGRVEPIGPGGAEGLAVARVRQPPFSFPALAVEGDVAAFLEPEPAQGGLDANQNGRVFETLLRVFRMAPGGAVDLVGAAALTADAAPVIDGRSLAVSSGLVFFRAPEAAAARQTTVRVSVASDGREGAGPSLLPALSADGGAIAFASFADLAPSDPALQRELYVHDRAAGTTELVSLGADGLPSGLDSKFPSLSADGRFVAFTSNWPTLVPGDTNGTTDVFVRDRVAGTIERVSVAAPSDPMLSTFASISADGRFVAFMSRATTLVPGDTNRQDDIFVRDRLTGVTERVSVDSEGRQVNASSSSPVISADGRFVAFTNPASTLLPPGEDTNGAGDVLVHDRLTGVTERASVASDGGEANGGSGLPALSADGRFVAFTSAATNLVAGDSNGAPDVFVHDRLTGTTERASVASDGTEGNAPSGNIGCFDCFLSLSADGRYVAFPSEAWNLVPGDTNGQPDTFVHDRLTGLTTRTSVADDGGQGTGGGLVGAVGSVVSADGNHVAFDAVFTNLVPADTNGALDVFLREADPDDVAADLTGNGRVDDTVLRALDAATGAVTTLCPATAVSVAAGAVAFLRPEAGGDAPGCPPGPDLDGDGDADDLVVHAAPPGGPVVNLGRAATAVVRSERWIAAILADGQVAVHPAGVGAWADLGVAGERLGIADGLVAFIGRDDGHLRLWDADAGRFLPLDAAAEEYALGDGLVAFRTREAAEGRDLNGDGDPADAVLRVYDVAAGRLVETGQAAIPCRLEACDPRFPYKVQRDTVTFLTLESDQGADLNGNGNTGDLVLQTFNVRAAGTGPAFLAVAPVRARRPRVLTPLAAVGAGVCTDTGEACATSETCPDGTCFVPPGGCLRDLNHACALSSPVSCPLGQFCAPVQGAPGFGSCHTIEGPCTSDADCTAPARCNESGQRMLRVAGPLTPAAAGEKTFMSAGLCVEETGAPCDAATPCAAGEACGAGGTCRRERGSCVTDAGCPAGTRCVRELMTAVAADADGDEIPDPFDVCPDVADVAQTDTDGDGIGDACDRETCGNGVVEGGEACDGTADAACPGACRSDCSCPCAALASGAHVLVKTGAGVVVARLRLPVDAYGGEPVSIRLDDADSTPIASRRVGALPASGDDTWIFLGGADGLRRVRVHRRDGGLAVRVRARRWFKPAEANQPASGTLLTVTIGDRCFTAPVTRKVE